MRKRYLLLDRDGTVIVEKNYLADPAQVELTPGAAEALAAVRALGWGIILVTNQAGIGRGYFTEADVHAVHARLAELLNPRETVLDGIYFCPHAPDDRCGCRKPAPGLVHRAAAERHFDPRDAVMVGDNACDIDLGRAVGAVTCLVRTGYGRTLAQAGQTSADYVIDDLRALPALLAALPVRAG